jgi:DGQHR domain-containing protein
VQRILNTRRIASVKNFTIEVGDFPGSVILNWISNENPIIRDNNFLTVRDEPFSAQIIDGQHRVAGIKAAIEEKSEIASLEIPVAIYENLSTRECADIFLSINTEQKTVPRSLVFDLYGVASEPVVDPAAVRARDIALSLNEEEKSPYFDQIKLPGAPTRKGGIALSTAVMALKPLVEERGSFEQIGVSELELQKQIILNFFQALKNRYGELWEKKTNAFNYASGFVGAIELFKLKIIPYCNQERSFTVDTIEGIMTLDKQNLIYQDEVKGLGGTEATKRVYERLVDSLSFPSASVSDLRI